MHPIEKSFLEHIRNGISRAGVDCVSKYASKYRFMGPPIEGRWTTHYHPWLVEIMDCEEETEVTQKAAQTGCTEGALNKVFYYNDIRRMNVLYVLPAATPHAGNFSRSRFDAALELSPRLTTLYNNVRNVDHKRAGAANLFIRGSRSKTGLKSDPCPVVIFDEVEEMVFENIALARERASGQLFKHFYYLSTPSHEDLGINELFKQTDQRHFMLQCPHHSVNGDPGWFEFYDLEDCLVVTADSVTDPRLHDSYIQCPICKHPIEREEKVGICQRGRWEATTTGHGVGHYINQFYSYTVSPAEIAEYVLKAQGDQSYEQELWNSKLGRPHTVKGGRVEDEHIVKCISDCHLIPSMKQGLITMGVDVGKVLHVEINRWYYKKHDSGISTEDPNMFVTPQLLFSGTVEDFADLDFLLTRYNIIHTIIDDQPESRKAREWCAKYPNHANTNFFANNASAREIIVRSEAPIVLHTNRTYWMDTALRRFINQDIRLPIDTPKIYKDHIKAPLRTYRLDTNQRPVGYWITPPKRPDHYAMARVYSEIALAMAVKLGGSTQKISGVY